MKKANQMLIKRRVSNKISPVIKIMEEASRLLLPVALVSKVIQKNVNSSEASKLMKQSDTSKFKKFAATFTEKQY